MSRQLTKVNSLTISGFRWKCMDGKILRLDEMETSHIFNAMKMIFNHLAEEWGGKPVWFNHQYSDYAEMSEDNPEYLAGLVLFFINEIERRRDLPDRYQEPYKAILEQLLQHRLSGVQLLEPHPLDDDPRALPE